MGERLHNNDRSAQTRVPPVHERVNAAPSELPSEEIIKRMQALPERQGRLIEIVDAIREANPR
jgi:hypothetical protein